MALQHKVEITIWGTIEATSLCEPMKRFLSKAIKRQMKCVQDSPSDVTTAYKFNYA